MTAVCFVVAATTAMVGSPAQSDTPDIIVVAGSEPPPLNDRALVDELSTLGDVTVVGDAGVNAVAAGPRPDLIVITTSVDPTLDYSRLASLPVPIVTWEPFVTDDLAIATDAGETPRNRRRKFIEIIDPDDPLAAGSTDRTYVSAIDAPISWARPGAEARVIAHVPGSPADAAIFTYDTGAELIDGSASPACRTMLFPTWQSSGVLTTVGHDLAAAAFASALACSDGPVDADGDGFVPPEDCDDFDANRHPGASEIADDGIDQDCDGRDLTTPSDGPVRNVVVIMTDDMNYSEYQYMPKTNVLLSGEGVTFDNAHQNTPLCCPARATLLTGQRSHHHGVHTNKPAQGQGYIALDHTNTLATWFEDAGYRTIHVGKYMNGYGQDGLDPDVADHLEVPPGWTDFQGLFGDIKYYDYTINDNGTVVEYGSRPDDYQTDVLAGRAVESIREATDAGQPFFALVSPLAPHTYNGNPPEPADRHATMFDDVPRPLSPNYNERDVRDKPSYVRQANHITKSATRKLDRHWQNQVESLQAVDDLVERVYLELERSGTLDETLIVFLSDNGYMFGEHRLTGKVRPYEESTHVPVVMRGGPFAGGARVDHVVSSTDLAPTITSLTGITPGLTMDGLDLSEVLVDPARYEDRAIIIEMIEGPGYEAVRTEGWLWIEYHGSGRELYDMEADPYQLDSRHKSGGSYKAVRTELGAVLDQLRTCAGIDCIARSNP